jgi:hypothetical protein
MTKVKTLLIKEPFKRVIPKGHYMPGPIVTGDIQANPLSEDRALYEIIPQSDFLRELYPSGHKINDPVWYPDKTSYLDSDEVKAANNGKGAWVTERVTRCAVPFQFIILLKHLVHLGGNPLDIMSSNRVQTDDMKNALAQLRQGWIDKNMEVAKWECFKAGKATGDVACVIYMDNGKTKYKVLSYLTGDKLYPQYDTKGRMVRFAREFKRLADDGTVMESYVEVWDDTYAYLFKKDTSTTLRRAFTTLLEAFGLDGYSLVEGPHKHGFNRIPVVYKRLDGPCWAPVQDNIDDYELSLSQLCESNKVYAFPIITMIGEDANVEVSTNGRPFAITSTDPDAKIGILNNNTGTDSFKLQLESQFKSIMMGSFIVTPPEVRSGDLPGVAIKLIYSPALENAMNDVMEWDPFIDDLFELFTYAYGIEMQISAQFATLNAHARNIPYIHQNTAETITLLSQAVMSNILSVDTAVEKNPFSMTDEQKRLLRQQIDANMATPVLPEGMNAHNIATQKTQ